MKSIAEIESETRRKEFMKRIVKERKTCAVCGGSLGLFHHFNANTKKYYCSMKCLGAIPPEKKKK